MFMPLSAEQIADRLAKAIADEIHFIDFLKERIGQKISISLHTETKLDMREQDPIIADSHYSLKLLGIYGFGERHGFTMARLIYIHGIDLKDDKEKLFRSNSEVMANEDSGAINFQSRTDIAIIDGKPVERWFDGYSFTKDKTRVMERMTDAGVTTDGPKSLENMAESLLKGRPNYQFGRWQPSHVIFTRDENSGIVDQILRYFDHII